MISNYIIVIFIAFLFNALVCILFKKIGFVDKPDGIRKIHKGEISLGGGLSLFLASLIIFFFPIEILSNKESLLSTGLLEVWFISLIILILGLLDDVNPLPTSVRLIIQILASWLVIIFTDIYVRDLGDLLGLGNFYLGQLGIPITIFMVVGMCNAFNMIDGMDGFVGIVTLAIVLAVPFITSMNGFSGILFIPSILLFCFLFFNLGLLGRNWKIFLGDSGSTWLGFLIAWFLIILSQGEEKLFTPAVALWFVLLPLIDALSTFSSRLWIGKSLFSGDRTHIHHLLMDSGFNKWKVLLIFLVISLSSSCFAIIAVENSISDYYLFYGFLTIWFIYFLLIKYPLINLGKKK